MNKKKEKLNLLKIVARFIKYHIGFMLAIIFFMGLISMAIFGNKGIIQRFKLESEKEDLEEQLKVEIKKTEDLQKEVEELKSSDSKLEKVAREKYGMTKEGEKIYKVIIDSTK